MFPVRFYKSFSKRKNSTKRPANTDAYDEINVELKENTTVETPSLVLTQTVGSASGNPVTVNALGGEMGNGVVTFNPIQTGTGTPAPNNPRPIVAYGDIQVGVNGNITYIDINGAKYGGVLDVATGMLTLKYYCIDAGTCNVTVNTANSYIVSYPAGVYPLSKTNSPNDLCSQYVYSNLAVANMPDKSFKPHMSQTRWFYFINYDITNNAAAMKAALSGVDLCFELQTYETVQLTPTQVALVAGSNTVTVNGNSTIAFNYVKGQIELDYVYAYIPDFDKYYFVSSPTILTDYHVQYDLVEDYLASRKTEVGSTVAHIVYSSTGYDVYKVDTRLPVKTTVTTNHVSKSSGLDATGCYILSLITDKANGKTGAIGHYLMSESNLQNLVANLYDISIQSVIAEAFYSPMDMIANCIWIPVSYADASALCSAEDTISLNNSPINTSGRPVRGCQVTTPIKIFANVPVPIPSNVGDFRDTQPYTSASLYLPGVGLTDININDFIGSENVNVYTKVDITNGDIIYFIYNDNNEILKTVSFNGAEPVPLAHISANSKGALTGIGGAAAMLGAAMLGTGSPASLLATGSLLAAGNTALSFNQRAVSIKGGYSGRSSFAETVFMLVIVKQNTEDPNNASYIARWGRPVGVTHAISNHSGYVQCEAASVAIAGDNTEREIINNYLNTGFFYE